MSLQQEVMQDQLDCPQMQQLLVELAGRMNMDDLVYLADAVLKVRAYTRLIWSIFVWVFVVSFHDEVFFQVYFVYVT